ncbi:MAG: OmpA family protein [Prevotellaceae bacterium]|nr:OmpA family protein [Prevotellaceae bacterium]
MMNLKRILAATALIACVAAPALAEEDSDNLSYKRYPHMFIGIQGGGQTTLTNFDNSKLITPTASVSFGAWFTPVVGARIHANGVWNKGGVNAQEELKYDYKYATADIDLMLNLNTLFGRKDYYPLNVYLIGGIGLNTAWGNDDANAIGSTVLTNVWDGKRFSHNARVGAQLDYNICKNVSVNLEVDANNLNDRYNSKASNKDDWQLTAQLGFAFKFGYKKKPVIVPEEIWETRVDTIWYDDTEYRDVTRDRDIKREIFFEIRESDVETTQEQIQAVAEFLKGVKDAEITITAYADKGTGNPKLNMMYSEQRAQKTRQALIDDGVDPDIIKSVEWKGDTVQPYEENDKNRLSVITGHGIYTDKDPFTVRKFRTEEVRYRVQ